MAASWVCIYIAVVSCACARSDGFSNLLASIIEEHRGDGRVVLPRPSHPWQHQTSRSWPHHAMPVLVDFAAASLVFESPQRVVPVLLRVENKFSPLGAREIDDWCAGVTLPKGMARIPKTFFQKRVVRIPHSHVREFASEILTAIVLFGVLVDCFIKPRADQETMVYVNSFELLQVSLASFQKR